jgi:hypothetical protein
MEVRHLGGATQPWPLFYRSLLVVVQDILLFLGTQVRHLGGATQICDTCKHIPGVCEIKLKFWVCLAIFVTVVFVVQF